MQATLDDEPIKVGINTWLIFTAGLVLPFLFWGIFGSPWDAYALVIVPAGFAIGGFYFGWKAVETYKDLLYAFIPLCGFPVSYFIWTWIRTPLAGDAGMGLALGVLYFFPVVLAPIYLVSTLAGKLIRDREARYNQKHKESHG